MGHMMRSSSARGRITDVVIELHGTGLTLLLRLVVGGSAGVDEIHSQSSILLEFHSHSSNHTGGEVLLHGLWEWKGLILREAITSKRHWQLLDLFITQLAPGKRITRALQYGGREGHCRGSQSRCGPPESRLWPPKGRPSAAAGRRSSAAPANLFEN